MSKISFTVDPAQLEAITKAIDGLSYKAPQVLKTASNKTGRKALNLLTQGVDRRYDFTKGGGSIKEYLTRKSATYANPRYVIDVKSGMSELIDFDVSHRYPLHWTDPASWVSARVLKASGRSHVKKFGHKAFVATFKSGHTSIVARTTGRKIKSLSAPGPAIMATQVWEEISDEINRINRENLDQEIGKVLGRING